MRIIRAADHRVMPWKNGGGVTREVRVEPDPADPARFLWRISIATVATAGPFSRFPGIDRSIAVLEGEGMVLDIDGQPATLRRGDAPLRFSGDAEVHSRLIGGETTDLNVMTRRSAFAHEMRRLHCERTVSVRCEAAVTVLVFNGRGMVSTASLATDVERCDVAVDISPGESVEVHANEPFDLFMILLEPLAARP